MKKTQLAAAIALAVSGAVLAPHAVADDAHAGLDQVRFTGGWATADEARGGFGVVAGGGTLVGGIGASGDPLVGAAGIVNDSGWDFGFGFDHHISHDGILGLIPGTEFYAELMINYTEYSDDGAKSVVTGNAVTVNEISISASPKLKFDSLQSTLLGFKPWIIPMGVEINVISPPSGAVTVTSIGSVHAIGVEYNLLGNLWVGGEGRYHWSPDDVDGTDTDGFTVSGSVGFAF